MVKSRSELGRVAPASRIVREGCAFAWSLIWTLRLDDFGTLHRFFRFTLLSFYSFTFSPSLSQANMAPFNTSSRRRESSDASYSGRRVRSRATASRASNQSNFRSGAGAGSRASVSSRRSSNSSSLQGQGRQRASVPRPQPQVRRQQSGISVASSRTFAGDEDDARTVATEQRLDDFDADVDALTEVIMAVNMTERGTVGCAYYVARDEKLYFMEDVVMGGADVVDARKSSLEKLWT